MFHVLALSGDGAGSIRPTRDDSLHHPYYLLANPYMETWKAQAQPVTRPEGHVQGGPVPPGKYAIDTPSQHPHLGLSARLVSATLKPMGRDGFFIHGQGPHGSNGCIVPLDGAKFGELMRALTDTHGGTLFVRENMSNTTPA
jgi:hypothetical protein